MKWKLLMRETGTVWIIYEGQCQDAVCGLASLFLFEQLSVFWAFANF